MEVIQKFDDYSGEGVEESKGKQKESTGEVENVRVVVRVRPLNEKEISGGYVNIVEVDELNGTISVENCNATSGEPPKVFTFDLVFGTDCKQVDVYNQTARPIVEKVLQGYNGTIFAYGQTGTGKTFTMEGDRNVPELKGIIPNSFAHIFGFIAKSEGNKKFLVRVSYLEIYNEEVRDLLGKDQTKNYDVKERPDIGVYVKDLSSYVVNNADDMDRIMTVGNKNRAVGSTNMNAHSSRSHAIFTITIESSERGSDGQQHVIMGKLHLVDLAGSERQSKTGATGQRLKEATKINLSLSTLGNVISALVDGKSTHIPYRNSKLTRLLQDSLGGNAKTVMCANVGPADYNYDETISTLRYANRAKSIKNRARVNEDPKDALLRQFQQEIAELKKKLADTGTGSTETETEDGESSEEGIGTDKEMNNMENNSTEVPKKEKKKKKGGKKINDEMEELKVKISNEKMILEESKDLADEEKQKITSELETHESELQRTQGEHEMLQEKLKSLERKILIGGENLLEKAEEQEKLLAASAQELEERKQKETQLRHKLQQKEAERVDIEERYSSLQEEAAGKTKKLKKVWSMLLSARAELKDLQQENQREMEGLLDNIRQLSRESKLQSIIIDSYIPREYQDMIERFVHWNEDIGEWQLKCVAYTGNNMRKQVPIAEATQDKELLEPNLSNVYLSYTSDRVLNAVRPRGSRAKSSRPRGSTGVRPKSSKIPV